MNRFLLALAVSLLLLESLPTCAQGPEGEDSGIPAVGRPAGLPFSEASGRFRVRASAAPTELQAEAPLTYTVTVEATSRVRQPPERIDLNQVPAFVAGFFIEDGAQRQPQPGRWEFDYRLQPRRLEVTTIPSLPFVYYDPDIQPASRGFQVIYTDPISLHVHPRAAVAVPLKAPAPALGLEPVEKVVARPWHWPTLGPVALIAILLLPPLGCLAWYACWRRLNPDAGRLIHLRRSRAARRALHRLAGLPRGDRGAAVARTVTEYLHERLDLATVEPTPAEARDYLLRHGCSADLASRAAEFYEACDRVRFVPGEVDGVGLPQQAEEFILAMEAATCPAA